MIERVDTSRVCRFYSGQRRGSRCTYAEPQPTAYPDYSLYPSGARHTVSNGENILMCGPAVETGWKGNDQQITDTLAQAQSTCNRYAPNNLGASRSFPIK